MLKFWELAPSPNNVKVRLALRFKGIDFEVEPVDVRDRAPLLEVSGQVLSPVIEAKGVVLNDSEAILQFLDANYRDTPRLFSSDREGRKACDGWRDQLHERLVRHWAPVFFHAVGFRDDLDAGARDAFQEAVKVLDAEYSATDTVGAAPIDDLRVATWVGYAIPTDAMVARVRAYGRTRDLFGLSPSDLPNLRRALAPWFDRLA